MLKILNTLDRRWIFLAMGLAIAVPILVIGLTGKTFPETPTKQRRTPSTPSRTSRTGRWC